MAVKIRMKKLGRKHRPFFRICAVDSRAPRDGRVIEELGTYDPMIPETDGRTELNNERISYWIGVGAQPSDNVRVLIKKYGAEGTHLEEQKAAKERRAAPKAIPDQGAPAFTLEPPRAAAPAEAAEPAAAAPPAEEAEAPPAEEAAAPAPEEAAEAPAAEETAAAEAADAAAEAPAEEAAAEESTAATEEKSE